MTIRILSGSNVGLAIAAVFGALALALSFPVQQAEAASTTFSSDTTITTDQAISSGESWTVNSGVTLNIAPGVVIENFGSISNSGTINNNGGIDNTNTIINNGTINNNGGISSVGTIKNNGILNNNGDIINECDITFSTISNYGTINNDGTIDNNSNGCTFNNFSDGVVNNFSDGTINNYETINNYGTIYNFGGTLNNYSTVVNNAGGTINNDDGTINNLGTIDNSDGGIINNNFGEEVGTINNSGTIDNNGTINNHGTIFIAGAGGTLDNGGTLNNTWFINNYGTINNNGTVNNDFGGEIDNNGTVNNSGTINISCFGGAIFNDHGTFTGNPVNYELCITLSPANANNTVGGIHTLTAHTYDLCVPREGFVVTFNVTSGPNAGTTGTNITDSAGNATFTYSDTGGAGTDTILASYMDPCGVVGEVKRYSNTVTKNWIGPPAPQTIGDIINAIKDMNLPSQAGKPLIAPLKSAQILLEDDNGSNDTAVCGKLSAFQNIIQGFEKNGKLTEEQANQLIDMANALLQSLDC